jgi:uncharacterized protein YciI
MAFFAVRLEHGGAWSAGRPLEEQEEWEAHAGFMERLVAERWVVLGGPLGEDPLGAGGQVLLIFEADSEEAIRRRLADDPWHATGLLVIAAVEPWQIRLRR